jgi:hypothetical protein
LLKDGEGELVVVATGGAKAPGTTTKKDLINSIFM